MFTSLCQTKDLSSSLLGLEGSKVAEGHNNPDRPGALSSSLKTNQLRISESKWIRRCQFCNRQHNYGQSTEAGKLLGISYLFVGVPRKLRNWMRSVQNSTSNHKKSIKLRKVPSGQSERGEDYTFTFRNYKGGFISICKLQFHQLLIVSAV
ncbi:hypothetical protein J6590_024417 [Homalodisca vitripennis]|nr:hypothetical protein J6590_024417 [Homalodisca vitripennis]